MILKKVLIPFVDQPVIAVEFHLLHSELICLSVHVVVGLDAKAHLAPGICLAVEDLSMTGESRVRLMIDIEIGDFWCRSVLDLVDEISHRVIPFLVVGSRCAHQSSDLEMNVRTARTACISAHCNDVAFLDRQLIGSESQVWIVEFFCHLSLAHLLPYLVVEGVEMGIDSHALKMRMCYIEHKPISVGIDSHALNVTISKCMDRMANRLLGLEVEPCMEVVRTQFSVVACQTKVEVERWNDIIVRIGFCRKSD